MTKSNLLLGILVYAVTLTLIVSVVFVYHIALLGLSLAVITGVLVTILIVTFFAPVQQD